MNSGAFLVDLAHSSIAAAILATLVFALQSVFRKHLTPHWRSMLWLLVVARLLPISVNSDLSLFNLFPEWIRHAPVLSAATPDKNESGNSLPKPNATRRRHLDLSSRPTFAPQPVPNRTLYIPTGTCSFFSSGWQV